jgi:hypothetical protein
MSGPNPADTQVARLVSRMKGAQDWYNAQKWAHRLQCPKCGAWTEKGVDETKACAGPKDSPGCGYVHPGVTRDEPPAPAIEDQPEEDGRRRRRS